MNQVARNTDPATSWAAANSAKELAKHHSDMIIECLCKYGALGKDGIAARTGLDGNQVARRLNELQRDYQIILTGMLVRSNSGRSEREWRVMPKQHQLI